MRILTAAFCLLAACSEGPETVDESSETDDAALTDDALTDDAPSDTDSDDTDSDDTDSDDTDTDLPPASPGCGSDPSALSTTLSVQGTDRQFVLHLPPNYDPSTPTPLVLAIHGLAGDGALAQLYFGLTQTAGETSIIVYPDALPLPSQGGATGWDISPRGYDFAFFDALDTHLKDHLCIDDQRIYAAGHSFGGIMSHALACYRQDRIAAIGVAGSSFHWHPAPCDGPVDAWLTHGEQDAIVPFSDGESARDRWIRLNSCDTTTVEVSPQGCLAYDGCSHRLHWCPFDGGHEWPRSTGASISDFFGL